MELNKRKSLLTPAAPTVWGMIHGDISKQTDINDRVKELVVSELGELDLGEYIDLTGYATETWVNEQGYLTEHQDLTAYATIEYVNTQIGEINTITEDILS